MPQRKIVYVSAQTHRRLKSLAKRWNCSIGQTIEALTAQRLVTPSSLWTFPEGLALQQKALAKAWDDPALDVYDVD